MSILISQSALISELYQHFFQKLKYYTLRKKSYSRKLFYALVTVIVNAANVRSTVKLFVESEKKTIRGSVDKSAETILV